MSKTIILHTLLFFAVAVPTLQAAPIPSALAAFVDPQGGATRDTQYVQKLENIRIMLTFAKDCGSDLEQLMQLYPLERLIMVLEAFDNEHSRDLMQKIGLNQSALQGIAETMGNVVDMQESADLMDYIAQNSSYVVQEPAQLAQNMFVKNDISLEFTEQLMHWYKKTNRTINWVVTKEELESMEQLIDSGKIASIPRLKGMLAVLLNVFWEHALQNAQEYGLDITKHDMAMRRLAVINKLGAATFQDREKFVTAQNAMQKKKQELAPLGVELLHHFAPMVEAVEHAIATHAQREIDAKRAMELLFGDKEKKENKPAKRKKKKKEAPRQAPSSSAVAAIPAPKPIQAEPTRPAIASPSPVAAEQDLTGFVEVTSRRGKKKQELISTSEADAVIKQTIGGTPCTLTLHNVLESKKAVTDVYLTVNKTWDGGKIELERVYTGAEEWKKQDIFHQFSSIVDNYLPWGWVDSNPREDGEAHSMYSLFGTFEYVWDNKKIIETGFFQYTFDANGKCYHRCFKAIERMVDGAKDFIPPKRSYINQYLIKKALKYVQIQL